MEAIIQKIMSPQKLNRFTEITLVAITALGAIAYISKSNQFLPWLSYLYLPCAILLFVLEVRDTPSQKKVMKIARLVILILMIVISVSGILLHEDILFTFCVVSTMYFMLSRKSHPTRVSS